MVASVSAKGAANDEGSDDADERGELDERGLRAMVDNLPAMIAYWDAGLRCRFANRAYEMWFGVAPETMIGRGMEDFLGPLFALNRPFIEGALRGEPQEFERDIPDPAGGPARHSQAHYIPDIANGKVRGFCVLVVDVTRRKRAERAVQEMERKVRENERLAAMATLASGIAHEINNPLASALANIELTLETIERGTFDAAAIERALLDARDEAQRVSGIVDSLNLLARGESSTRELVDVDKTLEQSLELASNAIRYRAEVVRDLGGAGLVEANAALLAQVFLNLLVNASQAVAEETAAKNRIGVATRREGDRAVIEIRDNGPGIPEELRARIFEPFFTTKDVGAAKGLGLSISNGIVTALGGQLSVRSQVGDGSVFRVELPGARDARAPRTAPATRPLAPAAQPATATARARVLIVDDEPAIARTLERVLGSGYDVTILTHGRDAIATLTRSQPDYQVVLCDLMMPQVSGADVWEAVTAARPELAERFVFMTGGAFTTRGREFLARVPAPVLEKPFDLARVRELVAARAARAQRG